MAVQPTDLDTTAFRRALGMFATGITVVTALGRDGRPVGLTVNSFNSVSLAPPLVVWSVANHLPVAQEFVSASHFLVNVLAADQLALSQRFATRAEDKFEGLTDLVSERGLPRLPGTCAWLCCRNAVRHAGGDHTVFIGEVEAFGRDDKAPLLYFGGRYRWLADE